MFTINATKTLLLTSLLALLVSCQKEKNPNDNSFTSSVFIGDITHGFYNVNAHNGALKTAFSLNADRGSFGSATYSNGVIYTGNAAAGLYAFDAATCATKWKFSAGPNGIISTPVVVNGTLYVGSQNYLLYAIDAATGEKKWQFSSPDNYELSGTPVVSNGIVYMVAGGRTLYALDATNGQIKWERAVGYTLQVVSPTLANGIVYVSTDKLYAFDAATGQLKWQLDAGGYFTSPATVADGVLYVGRGHTLYALNPLTGQQKWMYPIQNTSGIGILHAPALANGLLYIYGSDILFAIDPQSGQKNGSMPR